METEKKTDGDREDKRSFEIQSLKLYIGMMKGTAVAAMN